MNIDKAIQQGCDILTQMVTLSNRFLSGKSREERQNIAYASLVDMLNLLRAVKLPDVIPFSPSWRHQYCDNLPTFSWVCHDILAGNYKKACWSMGTMLECAQEAREPYFFINQYRCLLEKWAGVEHMSIWQRPVRLEEKLKAVQKEKVVFAYSYALSQLDNILGNSTLEKIKILMQMIKNDLKFSSIDNILMENAIRPSQCFSYIPAQPQKVPVDWVTLDSAHTDIVIRPYDTVKMAGAVERLSQKPFIPDSNYHDGVYWPELDLAVMCNGIHHSSIALSRGEVVYMKAQVVPLAPWFDVLESDGLKWKMHGIEIADVLDFRFALLFELAKRARDALMQAQLPDMA